MKKTKLEIDILGQAVGNIKNALSNLSVKEVNEYQYSTLEDILTELLPEIKEKLLPSELSMKHQVAVLNKIIIDVLKETGNNDLFNNISVTTYKAFLTKHGLYKVKSRK